MHPYVRFRINLARHGLAQIAATLQGSIEIVALAGGPLILGLLATAALPPVLAANLPLVEALPLLLLHALVLTLPAWLLRNHLLPNSALAMLRALPVPSRARLQADALVAAMVTAPLALAYTASLGILLWQQPTWMHQRAGVAATVLSCVLTWLGATLLLDRRGRTVTVRTRRPRNVEVRPYIAPRWQAALLWRRLFWIPAWRGATVGPRQTALLVASCVSAACWMQSLPHVPPAVLALSTSVLLILLAHLGDQATRTQVALLRPLMAGWPMAVKPFEIKVRALTLAPSLLVCAVLFQCGVGAHLAGRIYLALTALAPALLIALPETTPRTRLAWVAAAILILTAIGSEA
jgi:hypothetical protein